MFIDVHTTMLKASLKAAWDDVLRIDSGRRFHAMRPDRRKRNLAQQTWYTQPRENIVLSCYGSEVAARGREEEFRCRVTQSDGAHLPWNMFGSHWRVIDQKPARSTPYIDRTHWHRRQGNAVSPRDDSGDRKRRQEKNVTIWYNHTLYCGSAG